MVIMGRVEYPSYRQTETLAENCIATKVGGTVSVSLWPFTATSEDVWEEVGTLPVGWRPYRNINASSERGFIEVSRTGLVRCKRIPGKPASIYCGTTFVV